MLAPLNGARPASIIANAPLVFVGYGVDAPERGWDDFKGQDVHGKIAGRAGQRPRLRGCAGEPVAGKFGGKAMTYYGRWTYKYEEAARQGAAGVIIIHETAPASYGWDVGPELEHQHAVRHRPRQNPAAAHTPFESWIQRPLAVAAVRSAPASTSSRRRSPREAPDFQPIPLKATLTRALFRRRPQVITSPQRRRPPAGQEISRRDDHLLARTGTISASASPTRRGDTHLQRRGRQRHRHCPADRAGARRSRTGRAPTARSCSSPSPPRRRACSARTITRPTRSIPLGKTVADLNVDAWHPDGPAEELHAFAAPRSSTCSMM